MNGISRKVNIAACLGLALLILLPVGRAEGASDNALKLLELARKKFPTVTEAEKKLFQAVVVNDKPADYSDRLPKNNNPNDAKEWKETRAIRADVVAWLCTDREASAMVTHKGLWIKGARIDGELDLEFGVILFPLRFIKCAFMEKINLRYAEIRELQLIGTYTRSIDGGGLKVKGSVYFRESFHADGEVRLYGATIDKYFVWTDISSPRDVMLDLRSASIGTLCDDAKSWAEKQYNLCGLVYKDIDENAPRNANSRIKWLSRQKHFQSQPYEQLAAVFRRSGKDVDAKEILIAKNKDLKQRTKLTWPKKYWYYILGPMIGYGYRPMNAFWIVGAFIILGWILFGIGYKGGLITPQNESAYIQRDTGIVIPGDNGRQLSDVYPRLNCLIYSLDAFVPLIDLHQAKYWLPNANRGPELFNISWFGLHTGGLLRLYLWIHIIMGWLLTTLLIVGLSGLIRT